MPIKLKHQNVIPKSDYETVSVLGLEVPLTKDLPFGAQVELLDLQTRHEQHEFGQLEYLLRIFCVFTRRLPKGEHVRYEWLATQKLEADEVTELVNGTLALLTHHQETDEGEAADSGNAPTETAATES